MNNTKKKKLPPKVENMTKEELLTFLKKKKQCESVAQRIVEELLEGGVTEHRLLECLPQINQCHYEDVIEERAIVKQCGYPLCRHSLPDKLPTQQYKISSKTNRVFDITMRKNFCTNGCYKASQFLKEQLLTGPLWCRELEEIPQFTLMPLNTVGVLGEEIDLPLVKKIDVESNNGDFKSFFDFTQASLEEMSLDDDNKNIKLDSVQVINNDKSSDQIENNSIEEKVESQVHEIMKISLKSEKPIQKMEIDNLKTFTKVNKDDKKNDEVTPASSKKSSRKVNCSKIIGEVIERRSENKIDPIISEGMKLINSNTAADKKIKNKEKKTNITKKIVQPIGLAVIHIEKCLGEWFTLETMLFLFGEARVKELVTDKGDCIKEYLNNMACGLFYKSTAYDQYQQLCKKLNLLELEDRRYDTKVTSTKKFKPLPHFSMLREDTKNLDIKVRAFLKGEMEIPETKADTDDINNIENDEEETLPNLPLVDKTAQNALRRKIVLNSFNKVLPDLLLSLAISSKEITNDLRLLVATFHLQAHNIVFKPQQWNMISIIVIKLLSIKDVTLQTALSTDRANKHMQLLLMSYEQDGGYLDRVTSWLTDVDRLLDKNHTQLTVDVKS